MTLAKLLKHFRMRAKEPFQVLAARAMVLGLDRRPRWVGDLAGLEPRAIVATRTDRIGDLLVCSPLLWAMRQRWPGARLVLVHGPKNRDVLDGLPFVEAGPVFKPDPRSWVTVSFWLARQRFDLAVALRAEVLSSVMLAAASRAPVRAITHVTKMLPGFNLILGPEGNHHLTRYCAAAAQLGFPCVEPRPVFVLSADMKRRATEALRELRGGWEGRLVGLQMPFRGDRVHTARAWPLENLVGFVRALTADGWRVVLCGTGSERREAALIREAVPEAILGPQVALGTFGAVQQGFDAFVASLTGSLHLADAVGIPTVTYTTPHFAEYWRPIGPRHRCVTGPTIPQIPLAAVLAATRELLADRPRS